MANIRYNVTCPSCEATVTIRSSAAIGKKAECPKCKYRFTVPEPDDAEGGDEDAGAKKGKKEKTGGKGMVLALAGVAAVVVLGAVGYFVFMGGDEAPKKAGGGGGGAQVAQTKSGGSSNAAAPGGDGGMADPMGTAHPTGMGEAGDPMNPAGEPAPKKEAKKAAPKRPGNLKDPTNLLPGDTVAVLRVNPDRLDRDATPVATALLDGFVRDLFRNSLAFDPEQLGTYIHALAGPNREPFAVFQTKQSFDPAAVFARPGLEPAAGSPVKGRNFYRIKSNPLVNAAERAFSAQSLASMAGVPLPGGPPKPAPPGTYALCVYDTNTLLISTEPVMAKFLGDLKADGYPPFKTDLAPAAAPRPQPAAGAGDMGSDMSPMGPGGMPPMRSPMGPGSSSGGPPAGYSMPPPGAGGPPGGPMGPGGEGGQPPAAAPKQVYTSVPTYRTVEPPLKRLLNQMEEDERDPPAVVYAELVNQQAVNGAIAQLTRGAGSLGLDTLTQIRMIGATLKQLGREKGEAVVTVEYANDEAAKKSVSDQIMPLLALAKPRIDELFGTQTQVTTGLPQGAAGQGGEGGYGPMGYGPPGSGPMGYGPPGSTDGGGGMGRSYGPPPGYGPPGGSGGGVPGRSYGPPPGYGPPGSSGTPMGVPGSSDAEGSPMSGVYDPANPAGGGFAPSVTASKINVAHAGSAVTVSAEINWKEDKFVTEVHARVSRAASMLKGRMAVLAGEGDWHTMAAVVAKLSRTGFPRGTFERPGDERRLGLPYPPDQRVSFMADLLPHLGRRELRGQIDTRASWYGKENLDAAEAWVPEFLVPYYPQTAWRASHPQAEGRGLGGANYVALAGLGLDAARYDPNSPDDAKRVGMTGYEWGSKPDDVKDGLSNTIYMIQAPPGDGRPWIAGGGSTVVGVDDQRPDPLADFVHTTGDGKKGTYVLMGDGSVRWVKAGTDPKVFTAMVTRAGGESLTNLDTATEKLRPAAGRTTELTTGEKPQVTTAAPPPPPKKKDDKDAKGQGKDAAPAGKGGKKGDEAAPMRKPQTAPPPMAVPAEGK